MSEMIVITPEIHAAESAVADTIQRVENLFERYNASRGETLGEALENSAKMLVLAIEKLRTAR